ncbi:hypothetical protein EELLY_v1c02750 [Entomoplasma ellychniae]|uniref:Uncharacterized protein n=1 Tax=Entomoplasma ellychniae TaxID=2114 RepID=A0A8E2QXV6_9MOLU|nr:hypothetical protein EELLY_v1c02750 [Entomoplasma ellychniae]
MSIGTVFLSEIIGSLVLSLLGNMVVWLINY